MSNLFCVHRLCFTPTSRSRRCIFTKPYLFWFSANAFVPCGVPSPHRNSGGLHARLAHARRRLPSEAQGHSNPAPQPRNQHRTLHRHAAPVRQNEGQASTQRGVPYRWAVRPSIVPSTLFRRCCTECVVFVVLFLHPVGRPSRSIVLHLICACIPHAGTWCRY